MSDKRPNKPILAHADGELTGADQAEMVRRAAADPAVARQVAHQRQLREAVARVMVEPGEAPADLRSRIAATPIPPAPVKEPPAVIASIGRWAPAAAAAVLFIAALAVLAVQSSSTDVRVAGIMPVSQVQKFAKRHVACTHSIAPLYELKDAPSQVAELPRALSNRLGGQTTPSLDLSAIGYEFERVGACTIPGKDAVHLIYRASPETGREDRVSLWMVRDDGTIPIEANRVFTLADSNMPHPMLVWRSGGLVYYLVGDAIDAVRGAANLLAGSATVVPTS